MSKHTGVNPSAIRPGQASRVFVHVYLYLYVVAAYVLMPVHVL